MTNYDEVKVKLTNTQPNKYKSEARNKTGTALKITKKNIQDGVFAHELFLTIRQKAKIRNALANNMPTNIKLKTQIFKTIQPGVFLGFCLGKLGTKVVTDLVIPFAKNNLPGLISNIVSNTASNCIKKFQWKISRVV